jgi:hypothetical protein
MWDLTGFHRKAYTQAHALSNIREPSGYISLDMYETMCPTIYIVSTAEAVEKLWHKGGIDTKR